MSMVADAAIRSSTTLVWPRRLAKFSSQCDSIFTTKGGREGKRSPQRPHASGTKGLAVSKKEQD
jgi:hypothetical protein